MLGVIKQKKKHFFYYDKREKFDKRLLKRNRIEAGDGKNVYSFVLCCRKCQLLILFTRSVLI